MDVGCEAAGIYTTPFLHQLHLFQPCISTSIRSQPTRDRCLLDRFVETDPRLGRFHPRAPRPIVGETDGNGPKERTRRFCSTHEWDGKRTYRFAGRHMRERCASCVRRLVARSLVFCFFRSRSDAPKSPIASSRHATSTKELSCSAVGVVFSRRKHIHSTVHDANRWWICRRAATKGCNCTIVVHLDFGCWLVWANLPLDPSAGIGDCLAFSSVVSTSSMPLAPTLDAAEE